MVTVTLTMEIEDARLPELLRIAGVSAPQPAVEVIPPAVREYVHNRYRSDNATHVLDLIQDQLTRHPGVNVLPGTETTSYIRLYKPGPQTFGAYAYIRTVGNVDLWGLTAEDISGCEYAFAKDNPDDRYRVRVPLTNPDALAEAKELMDLTLERQMAA